MPSIEEDRNGPDQARYSRMFSANYIILLTSHLIYNIFLLYSSMAQQMKKSRSQIISSPFLLRFEGKVNQLSKQGTMTHHSQMLNQSTARKFKTAILQKNGENSLLSLDQIRHKNQDELQSNLLHSSVRSTTEQPTQRKEDKGSQSRKNYQFLKSVYLRGKNLEQDFQSMLSLLNKVQQVKNVR